MAGCWKTLGLALVVALGALALSGGGATQVQKAYATACTAGDEGTLRIRFHEGSVGGAETDVLGFRVAVSPSPLNSTHDGSLTAVDEGSNDDAGSDVGQIDILGACQTDHPSFPAGGYDFVASIVPNSDADDLNCTIEDSTINDVAHTANTTNVDFVVDCPATQTPTRIVLSLSVNPITCGSATTVFAAVTSHGDSVVDGTTVLFASSLGGAATAVTSDGVAFVNLTAPLTFSGSIVITAQSGAAEDQILLTVVCPTVPAQMSLIVASSTVACGTSTQVAVTVTNNLGQPVPNGTTVLFSASSGTITQVATTIGGQASATYTAPANTSGTAIIQATSGGLTRQIIITLTCVAPPAAPPAPTVAPSGQVAGQAVLPRAGYGPDPEANSGLLYAGVALIGAGSIVLMTSIRRRKAALPAAARLAGAVETSRLHYAGAALIAGGLLILGASATRRRKRQGR